MGIKFTDEQKRAIETLDRSVLVSAAAGSGKTAVLVERILSIILEGKANVDEMLIVTFTKAAAAEMKLRLAREIRRRMQERPEDAPRLSDQLSRLYRAYISTIDSFALRVIREFFYATDIQPDFGACDEVQGTMLQQEAVNELFDAGFADDDFIGSGDIGFREFLRLYSDERSEDRFKEELTETYSGLRSMPDYFAWARERAEDLNVTEENFGTSALRKAMLADAEDTFKGAYGAACEVRKLMYEAETGELYEAKLAAEVNAIGDICAEIEGGRLDMELLGMIEMIPSARLVPGKAFKERFEPVKDEVAALRKVYKGEIKAWKQKYMTPDFGRRLEEMRETYRYTLYYIDLLEEFERRYQEKKQERKLMDFADMEHNAVRILRDETAAGTMRKRFRYIFVDEYQDTNKIQEELIGRVSRRDNVFRVGDVKQSIYKFRQAQPEIFEELYSRFSVPGNEEGEVIDFGRNFRSNDATIRYINRVFETVMDGYDERAMLYTGCECDPRYDFIPEVHILTTDDAEDDAVAGTGEDAGIDPDIDEETEELSKEEAEAAYIADLAAGLIGTEFHDTKRNEIRRAQAKDIVILLRAVKYRGDILARALRARGIDSHVEESDDYFDTVEIGVALSLLTCIDNMKRDIPLIASLHSEVFGWTPDDLARVRTAHSAFLRSVPDAGGRARPAYWEALLWFAEEYPDDGDLASLKGKAIYARDKILEWRRLSRMMPLEDFIWRVLVDSGYYMMSGAMNGGAKRQANLRVLADRAAGFSNETVSSLSSYITFLDAMRKKKISNGQAKVAGSDDDVVRISTIHKSKGLEYPFVIVGGLGHNFRFDKLGKKLSWDSDVGAGLPYVDPSRKFWRSTLLQRAIDAKSRRDSYREELRILYVAMTRARNKLILTGTCSSEEKLMEYTARPANFLKVMRNVIRTSCNTYHVTPLVRAGLPARTRAAGILRTMEGELTADEMSLYEAIDRRFSYEYPDAELLTSKAKYSVSEIRLHELSEEHPASEIAGAAGGIEGTESQETAPAVSQGDEIIWLQNQAERRKKASAADIGIAYHRIMEFIDFARAADEDGNVCEEYIEECAELLAKNGAIERNVYESLDIEKIKEFFRSDLGRRAAAAGRSGHLMKEKAFTLKTCRNGRNMLVQGVIDCCFREDGKMVLIDYKSSWLRPGAGHEAELERIRNEYRTQIELYSEAVLKGTGMPVKEAYLYLFLTGEALIINTGGLQ